VTLAFVAPTRLLQLMLYVVVDVGATVCVPERLLMENPAGDVAVHLVASVLFQVSVLV
jgi:hypothetical protein